MHYLLMIDVAVTAVACFETAGKHSGCGDVFGSASNRVFCSRIGWARWSRLSVFVAMVSAVVRSRFSFGDSTCLRLRQHQHVGMMALSGVLCSSPRPFLHLATRVLARIVRRQKLSLRICPKTDCIDVFASTKCSGLFHHARQLRSKLSRERSPVGC